jgi:hypothetical protein
MIISSSGGGSDSAHVMWHFGSKRFGLAPGRRSCAVKAWGAFVHRTHDPLTATYTTPYVACGCHVLVLRKMEGIEAPKRFRFRIRSLPTGHNDRILRSIDSPNEFKSTASTNTASIKFSTARATGRNMYNNVDSGFQRTPFLPICTSPLICILKLATQIRHSKTSRAPIARHGRVWFVETLAE